MYTYLLTHYAERDFDKELAYSEEHWGKRHAKKYAQELKKQMKILCKNPYAYRERSDIVSGLRMCRYKGNYIVYTVVEEYKQVVITGLHSVYQNMDPEALQKRMP